MPDGDGAQTTCMNNVYEALSCSERRRIEALAAKALTHWEEAGAPHPTTSSVLLTAGAQHCEDADAYIVDGVLSESTCEHVLAAALSAAEARGGWDIDRHGKYRTTDMPLTAIGPVLEPLLREAVYDRILRPLCARYIGQDALPEHLRFSDTFFVKYEADGASAQTGLSVHTDGSTFSFNVLLSDPADFEGGGTFIEPARATVRPRRGAAVVHSGQVRHGGAPISSGRRMLLVGFIGVEPRPYSVALVRWAAFQGFCKFGAAAWQREASSPGPAPRLLQRGDPELLKACATEEQDEGVRVRVA